MDVNAEGSFSGGPAEIAVEMSAAEAAAGTSKTIAAPGGTPVMFYFPPGARDGSTLNVDLPWTDPATGATSTRPVTVVIRIPFPQYAPAVGAANRKPGRGRIIAVALVLALVGGACLVPALRWGNRADTTTRSGTVISTTTTTGVPEATVVATPAPSLDPAAFQKSLDEADRQLAAAVNTLKRATTPRAVAGAADALAEAVRAQAYVMSGVTAPTAAGAAYGDLISALSALEDASFSVSSSAESRSVCTGGSASAAFSRAGAAADLRSAITRLAAADPAAKYRFGSFLPAVTKDQNRRKANGSYLTRTTGGSGQFKTENGNAGDTVINLVKAGAKKPAVSVYVRGKKKVTTGRIKDGTYQVYVSSGADWDGKRFTRDCRFSKFDSTFKFTTTSRQYTIWQISLKPVLGGNATSSDVDPDEFPS